MNHAREGRRSLPFYQGEMIRAHQRVFRAVWHIHLFIVCLGKAGVWAGKIEANGGKREADLKNAGAGVVWRQLRVLGPADAPIAKISDVYRKVQYMKHPQYAVLVKVKDFLEKKLRDLTEWKKVSMQFDFNPMNG